MLEFILTQSVKIVRFDEAFAYSGSAGFISDFGRLAGEQRSPDKDLMKPADSEPGGGGGGTQIFLRRGCAPANYEMGI